MGDGYDEHEKLQIAKKYLIPNAFKKCGLNKENISLQNNDEVILELIKWYSRESGVRSLQQNIERICYKSSLELAEAGITYKDIHHHQIQQNEEQNDAEKIDENVGKNGKGKKILETLSSFVKRIASDKVEENDLNEIPEEKINEIPFVSITKENLKQYVGLRRYQNERTYVDKKSTPNGVVTGLAYTANGGSITYVETVKYKKNNKESPAAI